PEEVAALAESHTGQFLRRILRRIPARAALAEAGTGRPHGRASALVYAIQRRRGALAHNLQERVPGLLRKVGFSGFREPKPERQAQEMGARPAGGHYP
ncbi:MAG: hypothetical protein V1772_08010, partial [Chloroflexota bacterium]